MDKLLKINLPPGTLLYAGKESFKKTRIELIRYDEGSYERFDIDNIVDFKLNDNQVHWFNVVGITDVEAIKKVGNKFLIDPLVLEDILNINQRSKLEVFDDYVFNILKMIYLNHEKIVHEHLSIIFFKNIVITFQEFDEDIFSLLRKRIEESNGIIRTMKADYLYYGLIDSMVDQYFTITHYIERQIDELEVNVLDENPKILESIYRMRKELLILKTTIWPVKEVLNQLVYKDNPFVKESVRKYFSDVQDHYNQIYDEIVLYREMINTIFETYMSNVSNKMNQVMTVLTIFSAIFIPLTFLAGIYGMNFLEIPGLTNPNGFYYLLAGSIVIVIGMLGFFKAKKWI